MLSLQMAYFIQAFPKQNEKFSIYLSRYEGITRKIKLKKNICAIIFPLSKK